jgi:hypothetical protein
MKRLAAHYIYAFSGEALKLHFIELDDNRLLHRIEPLDGEKASTAFFNGVLFVFKYGAFASSGELKDKIRDICQQFPAISLGELFEKLQQTPIQSTGPVEVFQLDGIDLLSAKFRTGNGGGDCYVQRLC